MDYLEYFVNLKPLLLLLLRYYLYTNVQHYFSTDNRRFQLKKIKSHDVSICPTIERYVVYDHLNLSFYDFERSSLVSKMEQYDARQHLKFIHG